MISAIVFSAGSITSCVRTKIDFINDYDILRRIEALKLVLLRVSHAEDM